MPCVRQISASHGSINANAILVEEDTTATASPIAGNKGCDSHGETHGDNVSDSYFNCWNKIK